MKTAFLVDADFFLRNHEAILGEQSAGEVVNSLLSICDQHLSKFSRGSSQLYRIFVYDCRPIDKRVYNPVAKSLVNLGQTSLFQWRTTFHDELIRARKVALRLGKLKTQQEWIIRSTRLKDLVNGKITLSDLTASDVKQHIVQKGVDMRIGIDIANLAFRKLVDQIVLISGDSDFVPAAKLARREGIDFVLDPMGRFVPSEFLEHVDGIQSIISHPSKSTES